MRKGEPVDQRAQRDLVQQHSPQATTTTTPTAVLAWDTKHLYLEDRNPPPHVSGLTPLLVVARRLFLLHRESAFTPTERHKVEAMQTLRRFKREKLSLIAK